ncbi:hypothetical protein SBI_09802 [Streptomyces bingchenggensis BCW-1]|uniref:H repeat-associated protein N-terminal domain-containing protein n=1 Tax=Streptomyces bingchenggensis (strain BCW-1) TaxID=749414 RepID=D7CBP3_STRBB|nr:hypothetical protein SBI_09802 [Streptomyces bingchenggensis BCW-1]
MGRIPDPHQVRGRRYRLGSLLALCLLAVLGGAKPLAAIARFAAATDSELRERLGPASTTPDAFTLGRLPARLDGDALHPCQTVIAQRQVAAKSNEIPAFAPLPERIDLHGVVVTADATAPAARCSLAPARLRDQADHQTGERPVRRSGETPAEHHQHSGK